MTTLNGLPVPSPDPFRKSPQFDLFPSSLLESIVVSKSATADLSGESTAANFDLITKSMPEEFFLKGSIGLGFHSESMDDFRTFSRGGDDYLITDGAKDLNQAPRPTPTDALARSDFERTENLGSKDRNPGPNTSFSLSTGNNFEFENGSRLGVVFAGYHRRSTSAILDAQDVQGYDFSGADTLIIEEQQLPDFLGGGIIEVPVNRPIPFGDESIYDHEEYEESVKLGGLLGLSYEFGEDQSLALNLFTSRTSDTVVTRDFNGTNPDENITREDDLFLLRERLYFVERELTLGQIGGEHAFPENIGWEPKLKWTYQKARTTQDEPDFRDTVALYRYSDFSGEIPRSIQAPSSSFPNARNLNSDTNVALSSNSWRFVQEDEDSARIDLELQPTEILALETGAMNRDAERSSDIQSYIEARADADPNGAITAGLGPSVQSVNNGNNSIRGRSSAEREIDAYYLMARVEPNDWLKLNLGFRLEESVISVESNTQLQSNNTLAGVFRSYNSARSASPTRANVVRATEADVLGVPTDPTVTAGDTITRDLNDRDSLPSINLSLEPASGVQIKVGYYETINRPSFREITGDIFIDTESGDYLAGNPFLESSTTENSDLRIEFYPEQFEFDLPLLGEFFSEDDMFGFSVFDKEIENPIEFIRPTDSNVDEIPFNNPEGAKAEGVEFEFRKNLAFTGMPHGEFLSIGGNLSFTSANAGVSDAERALLGLNNNTDADAIAEERPLTEQPDRIINLDLTYSNPDSGTTVTLAWNQKSKILESIGSETAFDAFRGEEERLDLIVSKEFDNDLTLRVSVNNLLDEGYETFYLNRAPDFTTNAIPNLRDPSSFETSLPRKTVETVGRSFSVSVSKSF